MELTRRLQPPSPAHPGFVATIGGYDGLHIGHRELLRRTLARAEARHLGSLLVTFEPLPREYFASQAPPARLTSLRERCRLLSGTPLDRLCLLHFTPRLRELDAAAFAGQLQRAGVRELVIGHDFKAARDGEATAQWLEEHGPRFGFEVQVVEPVLLDGQRVGSRLVREALAAGKLGQAERMLGRRYSMRGRVQRGEQLGRKLGYPTANLKLARRKSPVEGIFAIRVRGISDVGPGRRGLPGVASLGTRPTVAGIVPLLEAHVFDYSGDLYGREIEVEFVAKLRDELCFGSVDAMVAQIHRDADEARAVLDKDR
jgi:riboflavin kinase / FMN adenylyltransferase